MKGQANIAGFLIVTLIVLVIVSMTFFWANSLIEKSNNFNEVTRMENRMIALHNAIKAVANEHTQRTVSFDIKEGWLLLANNKTIKYSASLKLPESRQSPKTVLIGNTTASGPCLNKSDSNYGTLGYDDIGCLIESGAIELELSYIKLNDTATGKCYGVLLTAGDNAGGGKGKHNVFLQYKHTNETQNLCPNTTWQVIEFTIK